MQISQAFKSGWATLYRPYPTTAMQQTVTTSIWEGCYPIVQVCDRCGFFLERVHWKCRGCELSPCSTHGCDWCCSSCNRRVISHHYSDWSGACIRLGNNYFHIWATLVSAVFKQRAIAKHLSSNAVFVGRLPVFLWNQSHYASILYVEALHSLRMKWE